jgi:hypothetical protein
VELAGTERMTMELTHEDVIRVGGLDFHGGAGFDGFYISDDGLAGWDDSPPVRFDAVERQNADGDYDVPVYFGARVVTVSGYCYANSAEELGVYRNRLMGIPISSTRITGAVHGLTTFTDGAMAAASKFEVDIPGRRAAYQFSRRCVNPKRYGGLNESVSAGDGTFTTSHYGNARASTKFIVAGTGDRWRITGPGGRSVLVTQKLYDGHPHIYDMATGLLTIEGVVQLSGVDTADSWSIPSGRQLYHTLSVQNGSATATALTYDTYI